MKVKKKIGLAGGLVGLNSSIISKKKKIKVFFAEHYPFLHHHAKIQISLHGKLGNRVQPTLYFSLEDEVARLYTERADFRRPFKLIEFTEKRYSVRWVRKIVAQRILNNIYRLRRVYWNEKFPLLTFVSFPSSDKFQEMKELKKGISKRLSSLCFCGSGKKFKDCHGKI